MTPTRDWCSHDGATEMAEKIRRYWAERGREIEVSVVPSGADAQRPVFGVRSTLVFHAPERAP